MKSTLRRSIFRTLTLAGVMAGPTRSALAQARNTQTSDTAGDQRVESGVAPAFLVAQVSVKDQARLGDYLKASAGTLEPFGGQFHVQAGDIHVIEGDWRPSVMIIAQFPSIDHARRWYQSPAYADALAISPSAMDRKMIFCEGLVKGV